VELDALVIEARSPASLAGFWSRALGWEVREAPAGDVELLPADGVTTFRLVFRPASVDEKVGQNPIHLDLTTSSPADQQESAANLLATGAGHIDVGQRGDEGHVVLADPEGNELCLIEPGNDFLASCPRLGAVNCDGTRALGHFFSAVLAWPLVWDQDEETAIQSPAGTGPKITWSGPPLLPKAPRERIHLHVAPARGTSTDAAVAELLRHGATYAEPRHGCAGVIPLADVDGNAVCLVGRSPAG